MVGGFIPNPPGFVAKDFEEPEVPPLRFANCLLFQSIERFRLECYTMVSLAALLSLGMGEKYFAVADLNWDAIRGRRRGSPSDLLDSPSGTSSRSLVRRASCFYFLAQNGANNGQARFFLIYRCPPGRDFRVRPGPNSQHSTA